MFLQLAIAMAIGICCGTFAGLVPGLHINLMSVILISISPFLLSFTAPITLAAFVVAMSITQSFLEPIPSTFLGAPDSDTVMAVLPAHALLLKGMGYEAVKLTITGSLLSIIFGTALVPLLLYAFPLVYKSLSNYIGWILIGIVVFMILKDRKPDKIFWNFFIFIVSGIFGLSVFNIEALTEPLLPMLSGLFGVSVLLISLNTNVVLPVQRVTEMVEIGRWETIKAVIAGTFSGGIISLFPGLGAAQAAIIAGTFFRSITSNAYLILVGAISAVNFLLSVVTFYTLQKARNGGIVAVMEIMQKISIQETALLFAAALAVAGIATVLSLNISKGFSFFMNKLNYKKMCIGVIAFITVLVAVLAGPIGILVFIVSTAIGMIPQLVGVGKNNAMGCLLLPVILYFTL